MISFMFTGNTRRRYIHWRWFFQTEWSNGIRWPF
jgi:hypothetical protein